MRALDQGWILKGVVDRPQGAAQRMADPQEKSPAGIRLLATMWPVESNVIVVSHSCKIAVTA